MEDEEIEEGAADGAENARRVSESAPTKIKPIPKYSAFFILSHTNW